MITESEDLESDYQYAMRWEEEGGEGDETEGGEGYETEGGEGEETNVIIINDNNNGFCSSGVSQLERNFSGIFHMSVLQNRRYNTIRHMHIRACYMQSMS